MSCQNCCWTQASLDRKDHHPCRDLVGAVGHKIWLIIRYFWWRSKRCWNVLYGCRLLSRNLFFEYMHFMVSIYVSCFYLLLPDSWRKIFTYCLKFVMECSWSVGFSILDCEYYRWPLESRLFQSKEHLGVDVGAFFVDVAGFWQSSFGSLGISFL